MALAAYQRRFQGSNGPWLSGRDPATEERVLRKAVARGRPLHPLLIERVTGGWRRMPGPDVIL